MSNNGNTPATESIIEYQTTKAEMYKAASDYTEKGFSITPLRPPNYPDCKKPGKTPFISGWNKRTEILSKEEVNRYWGNDYKGIPYNIGLVTGELSGITSIDFDDLNPAITNDLFKGIDTEDFAMTRRTAGRGHIHFKYCPALKSEKHHELGIEILNNGFNVVLPPSNHVSGEVYRWKGEKIPDTFPECPKILIDRLRDLFELDSKVDALVEKVRPCLKQAFLVFRENKNTEGWRKKGGRNLTLALCVDLIYAGARKEELLYLTKTIFREKYNPELANYEIDNILNYVENEDGKPWKCDTIRKDCSAVTAGGTLCTECKKSAVFEGKKKPKAEGEGQKKKREKKPSIPHNIVGNVVMERIRLFTMTDNEEIYVYQNGVYTNELSNAILQKAIRDIYEELYEAEYLNLNDKKPDIIPARGRSYVADVIEWIRAYTKVTRKQVDRENARYLNFRNGLFNLQTWELEPHTPDFLSIVQFNVSYNPDADCPKITHYFNTCELREQDVIVLMEFAGYSLTVDIALQKALMLVGGGSNGKSVFINMIKDTMGYQAVSNESLHTLENDKYRVANVYGKRLNAFPDLKDEPLQTNETFNILTGNDGELTGERKYEHSFRFKPTVKLLFSANKPPFAYSNNFAYYRRWMIIEFPRTFTGEEIDEKLIEKLTTEEEKSGLLNLMLGGLKRVLENGRFSYDLTADEVERLYKVHSDNVTIFASECLREPDSDYEDETEKTVVYNLYCQWCGAQNIKPISKTEFPRRMSKLGREPTETTTYDPETKKRPKRRFYKNTVVIFSAIPYEKNKYSNIL